MEGTRKEIDEYSYELGVMDCFCEMTAAGLKRMAMSHPCRDQEKWRSYEPEVRRLCQYYGIFFYPEKEPLITDLFPSELNEGTCHYLFYQKEETIEEYLALKKEKEQAVRSHTYDEAKRYEVAWRLGKLLSYPDEGIRRYIERTRQGCSRPAGVAEGENSR